MTDSAFETRKRKVIKVNIWSGVSGKLCILIPGEICCDRMNTRIEKNNQNI